MLQRLRRKGAPSFGTVIALLFPLIGSGIIEAAAPTVKPVVVRALPHDPRAYTQGLLLHAGRFYESTGIRGRSSLRRVVPDSGVVEREIDLSDEYFGEGLALVGDRLIQLTWKNQVAFVYDLDFTRLTSFQYTGEGWGLCFDGKRLVMSDGSSRLSFRDPATFEELGGVEVKLDGEPVTQLNELECVGHEVFANVWLTNWIVRIDPSSGRVLTAIDASDLLTEEEARHADVLNGIAYDPSTRHFFLTGKLWPKLFEVRIDADPEKDPDRPAPSSTNPGTDRDRR